MFLFERLFGVTVYIFFLILFCFLLWKSDESAIGRILFAYSVVLSIMAYFYVPYKTDDLYRIYNLIDYLKKFTFRQVLNNVEQVSEGFGRIYYWIFAQIGMPRLLPIFNCFICFNCIFYIIGSTAKRFKISGGNVALVLFFYMSSSTFMSIIGGIRCMLGVSLLTFCFYREFIENKFSILHVPLYLIACAVHSFVAILAVVSLFVRIFDVKIKKKVRLVYILFLTFLSVMAFIYMRGYIEKIFDKVTFYFTRVVYTYVWEYIVAIVAGLVICSVIVKSKNLVNDLGFYGWRLYLLLCMLIGIGFCYEFSIFYRSVMHISTILCLPVMMLLFREETTPINKVMAVSEKHISYRTIIFLTSLLLLFLSCSRGYLCSLKFFIL